MRYMVQYRAGRPENPMLTESAIVDSPHPLPVHYHFCHQFPNAQCAVVSISDANDIGVIEPPMLVFTRLDNAMGKMIASDVSRTRWACNMVLVRWDANGAQTWVPEGDVNPVDQTVVGQDGIALIRRLLNDFIAKLDEYEPRTDADIARDEQSREHAAAIAAEAEDGRNWDLD